jgi:hypothetical protein
MKAQSSLESSSSVGGFNITRSTVAPEPSLVSGLGVAAIQLGINAIVEVMEGSLVLESGLGVPDAETMIDLDLIFNRLMGINSEDDQIDSSVTGQSTNGTPSASFTALSGILGSASETDSPAVKFLSVQTILSKAEKTLVCVVLNWLEKIIRSDKNPVDGGAAVGGSGNPQGAISQVKPDDGTPLGLMHKLKGHAKRLIKDYTERLEAVEARPRKIIDFGSRLGRLSSSSSVEEKIRFILDFFEASRLDPRFRTEFVGVHHSTLDGVLGGQDVADVLDGLGHSRQWEVVYGEMDQAFRSKRFDSDAISVYFYNPERYTRPSPFLSELGGWDGDYGAPILQRLLKVLNATKAGEPPLSSEFVAALNDFLPKVIVSRDQDVVSFRSQLASAFEGHYLASEVVGEEDDLPRRQLLSWLPGLSVKGDGDSVSIMSQNDERKDS